MFSNETFVLKVNEGIEYRVYKPLYLRLIADLGVKTICLTRACSVVTSDLYPCISSNLVSSSPEMNMFKIR